MNLVIKVILSSANIGCMVITILIRWEKLKTVIDTNVLIINDIIVENINFG